MSIKQARIIYDFEGDAENGELVIQEGQIITILNQDIGDGWWEGKLENGESGLFPESYVEILDANEAAEPKPMTGGFDEYELMENGGIEVDQFPQGPSYGRDSFGQQGSATNKWEDEERKTRQGDNLSNSNSMEHGEEIDRDDISSPGERSNASQLGRAGTVRKNINRFSSFVKTGAEGYILGNFPSRVVVKPESRITIVASSESRCTPMWEPSRDPYTIEVKDPEKKKKFKGIKSFTAFSIIPSSTGRGVSRRYKHYAWLHDRLEEKFTIHCVPPLPDKQYYGRYGEDFVEKRREKLQCWSNRIARHPVISRSDVFIHFIHCEEGGQEWKTGKRRAEKDELIGPAYLQSFQHPDVSIEVSSAESTVEAFGLFLRQFKLCLSKMRLKFIDHCSQMSGPFMTEFHKMSAVMSGMATTFAMEDQEYAKGLTAAIESSAQTYQDIGKMHAEQPRNDVLPALDMMKEYLGLAFAFPDMVTIHRGAVSKIRECERMKEECRIDITDATEITYRSESVSAVVLSEIYHFQHERIIDMREMMANFLGEQICFYKEIVRKLELAKLQYNDGTDL